jgi:hypothetical protein
MSHYVTITRKPSPYWKSGPRISEAEWRAAVDDEGGFRPPTDAERAAVARFAAVARPTDLVWTGHPRWPDVWFVWDDGQVDVKNPDEIILALMARLATRLDAAVLGEQGERFDAAGNSLGVDDFPEEPEEPGEPRPSWWRRLFS